MLRGRASNCSSASVSRNTGRSGRAAGFGAHVAPRSRLPAGGTFFLFIRSCLLQARGDFFRPFLLPFSYPQQVFAPKEQDFWGWVQPRGSCASLQEKQLWPRCEQPGLAARSRNLKLNCIMVKKYLLPSPELNLNRALLFKQLLEP